MRGVYSFPAFYNLRLSAVLAGHRRIPLRRQDDRPRGDARRGEGGIPCKLRRLAGVVGDQRVEPQGREQGGWIMWKAFWKGFLNQNPYMPIVVMIALVLVVGVVVGDRVVITDAVSARIIR